jgi:hypothetical protein
MSDQPDAETSTSQHTNTHKRQASMASVGFEPAIPASERPQTHALDGVATGIGRKRLQHRRIILASEFSPTSHLVQMLGPSTFLSHLISDSKKHLQLFDKECTIYRRHLYCTSHKSHA